MRKKKLIIGNWKMNPRTVKEARTHFLKIKKEVARFSNIDVGIAAPFVFLSELSKNTSKTLALAAQNVSAEKEGAFTGEVAAPMLAPFKVSYVLVGHSERRALGESNELVNKKIKQILAAKMTPVLCVGETERDADMWYLGTVKTQLTEGLAGLPKSALSKIVIAYEPVWAISTTLNRRDATPSDFEEMRIYIKKVLADMFGGGDDTAILYGGSVDEKNAGAFLSIGNADGLLPGRASLSAQKFSKILKIANDLR